MFTNKLINVLLIEDEEFDVKRVKKTLEAFSSQIRIEKVVADGTAAINTISSGDYDIDIAIMDFQIAGGMILVVLSIIELAASGEPVLPVCRRH